MTKRTVETPAFTAFIRRSIAALGRRIAEGDCHDLRHLRDLRTALEDAEATAIAGLQAQGYTQAEVARGLGITRQAVHQALVRRAGR